MSGRLSLYEDRPALEEIWECYEDAMGAMAAYENGVLAGHHRPGNLRYLTPAQVRTRFDAHEAELDFLFSFSLLAAAEGEFFTDFVARVRRRLKDPVSREFRRIDKRRPRRISLREDILGMHRGLSGVVSGRRHA